jgi:hypothetical protein
MALIRISINEVALTVAYTYDTFQRKILGQARLWPQIYMKTPFALPGVRTSYFPKVRPNCAFFPGDFGVPSGYPV